jgi:biotin transport system substrate-specific component
MTSIGVARPGRVLADVLPGGAVRDLTLVVGSATFVGLSAQVAIPLGFTPIPLTGQTFAVLLAVAVVGPARGLLGMAVYLAAGVAGVPWFTQYTSGWATASFGYIVGFLLAAVLVGALARRGGDRTPARTVAIMIAGNLAIYAVGVPWLMAATGIGFAQALALGVVPFLIGDAIKIALAAGLLPTAWHLVHRAERH